MKRALTWFLLALPATAADPWKLPHSQWTNDDARRVLEASPWAKRIPGSNVTARWESARPIQLAIEKLTSKAPDFGCSDCYAIAIVGGSRAENPTVDASLKATGRPPVSSISARIIGDALVYLFPRQHDVEQPVQFRLPCWTLGNSVEFETRIDGRTIKRSFALRTMTYEGRLEL